MRFMRWCNVRVNFKEKTMRLITLDDFIDVYVKLKQRGLSFIISKFSFNKIERTKSAFNELKINSANCWIISKIHERWNILISGKPNINFKEFLVTEYLNSSKPIKMLSLGSGRCEHELEFAKHSNFKEIICIDISDSLIENAKKKAKKNGLSNISFITGDAYQFPFPKDYFDVVFFHASLHHFKNVNHLLNKKVKYTLRKNGLLIINEFVGANRLQYPKHQINSINKCLDLIPKNLKKRYKFKKLYKNKYYGSGLIRMIIADPSECIDSSNIMPVIHNNFSTICERPFGGNILVPALKDISHHFLNLNKEKEEVLSKLFEFENSYLKTHKSDYIFGIYRNDITKIK